MRLGLTDGMLVADFGTGSGHYAIEASRIVGNSGRVYAIDIQQALVKKVKNLALAENRQNIDVLWGDIEQIRGTKLGDESVDAVIIANDLFQVEEKNNVIIEARRILKPKGKVLVVDWLDSFAGIGPSGDVIVRESEARKLLSENGFEFVQDFDAGEHHYGLIFIKS
ncbi:MAG: methyltransferase domain-containing protein [Candidatus Pacebacteria bacterium]|nr:methyltransferase domain-containing protein [Candidatus Paceibacterota bacterium]